MDKEKFSFGLYYSDGMRKDIKKSMVTLARYKFAAKMAAHVENLRVLELGCNEGLGAYFFMQMPNCGEYVGVDANKEAISWGLENVRPDGQGYGKKVDFVNADFLKPMELGGRSGNFNALVSLDVIEHIRAEDEHKFMDVVVGNISDDGIAVIGTPNIAMRPYQPEETRKEHVNMLDEAGLHRICHAAFKNVFLFSMNDEVVHTGFAPMACYFFALCCGPRK